MFTCAVISPTALMVVRELPEPISYAEMVEVVHGYIEAVYFDGAIGYVNEEGKLQGLAKNQVATDLAHAHNAIYGDDWIAGNMLIVGECDDEGETMPLTSKWIDENLKEIVHV